MAQPYIVSEQGPEIIAPKAGQLTVQFRTRIRGRVRLAVAQHFTARFGFPALPLTNWLWMGVRFEWSIDGRSWQRLPQPRLFSDG